MDITKLIRENIIRLEPYTSARDVYSEGILLDANENSFGSAFNLNDIKNNHIELNRYPDPHQSDLRKPAADYYSLDPQNLFFGVGSDEIIDLLIRIFCEPGKDRVMIPEPTYGMYRVASGISGVDVQEVLLTDDFQVDAEAIGRSYTGNVKLIFLCSPNNPTGNLLKKNDILGLCSSFNSVIVVDEAYIDFAEEGSVIDQIRNYRNLVVLRTFSKAWGMAGIRLGFCAADSEVIKMLFKVKAPYNINTFTRMAASAAIKNHGRKDEFVKLILKEKNKLLQEISGIEGVLKVYDSDANFILFKCRDAKEIQKKLAIRGIIIRDRSSQPKLENCLRVSIGTPEQNQLFINTLKSIYEKSNN